MIASLAPILLMLILISILLSVAIRVEKKNQNYPTLYRVSYMALRYDSLRGGNHVSEERKVVEAESKEEALEKVKKLLGLQDDLETKDLSIPQVQYMNFEVSKL